MNKLSAKNKIFIVAAVWLALVLSMFFYFFNILDNSNQQIVLAMSDQQKNLNLLSAEKQSFIKGQQDLQALQGKSNQPQDFFSQDVTLVSEIEVLENWGTNLGVSLTLSGLSGTASTEPKASPAGDIVSVPYNITLSGPLSNVIQYMQVLENLDFITTVSSVSVSSGVGNSVNASMSANFYLRVK